MGRNSTALPISCQALAFATPFTPPTSFRPTVPHEASLFGGVPPTLFRGHDLRHDPRPGPPSRTVATAYIMEDEYFSRWSVPFGPGPGPRARLPLLSTPPGPCRRLQAGRHRLHGRRPPAPGRETPPPAGSGSVKISSARAAQNLRETRIKPRGFTRTD